MTRDPRNTPPSERRRRPTGHNVREAPGVAARRGALALLDAVLERGRMLDEAPLEKLPPAARAEAHGLADGTLRRLGQIDRALDRLLERRPKPVVTNALRLMAAELLFLGVAPHAAVDSAVRVVRATPGTGNTAGLVNAIGRRLAEAGPPEDTAQARRANLPRWLWTRLADAWGEGEADAIVAAQMIPAPHDLTFRAPARAAASAGTLAGHVVVPGTLRLAARPQLSALPGHAEGEWWVQDWAASLPARLLGAGPGMRVLDLCAAPGGKTMQLAAAGAEVTALDLSERRMARLEENLARTGLAAELVVADALDWAPTAPFDAILLDAPCSATGTLRRHPDLPWRRGAEAVGPLAELQARLLDRAWGWLRPGGRMVLATCSLLPEEGEAQGAAFLARTADAARRALDPATDPVLPEFVTAEGDLRTLPSMVPALGGLDGFYAIRLERRG